MKLSSAVPEIIDVVQRGHRGLAVYDGESVCAF